VIGENPFEGVKADPGDCKRRQRYIDVETTLRLLESAPSTDWRTIIALARFGGLRCPSEVLSLKWEHIDWERGLMRIPQPKVEHHGKAFRVCPIFGPLRPWLEAAWEAAPEGSVYVVQDNTYRQRAQTKNGWINCNLRTQLHRIIDRAGLEPWPRAFQNLRASCATDLVSEFPQHVVADWLGHSPVIAEKHYWQLTEEQLRRAIHWQPGPKRAAIGAAADAGIGQNPPERVMNSKSITPSYSDTCGNLLVHSTPQMAEAGFEPARGGRPTGF